jgi:6-phosphogluconolactonase
MVRIALALIIGLSLAFPGQAQERLVFVSSFAPGEKGAIQAYRLDAKSGALKPAQRTSGIENPFYLALSPDEKRLYSIHAKSFGGKDDEHVAAFQIVSMDGELKYLNRQSALGSAACYLDVDATGKSVLVANYVTGNVAALPTKADGSLGEAASSNQHVDDASGDGKKRKPHAHCIVVSPDNRFAFAADLGLDRVYAYKLDAAASKITPHSPPFADAPKGSGPRHLTFHPNGKHVYVINEYGNSVTHFEYQADAGTLARKHTLSTVPADFTGKSYCADLKITTNGRYLYGTNRGHDSIACYRIADDGSLTLLKIEPSLGKGPQNLAITPDGQWLLCANMPGNNLAVFRIGADGVLASAGTPITIASPSCLLILRK